MTSNFSAEYGMTMGSQTVMVSRGGTNQFHGNVFEFLRNGAMDARSPVDFTYQKTGDREPQYQRNNFGGSFGGPIRRDKTFLSLFTRDCGNTKASDTHYCACRRMSWRGGRDDHDCGVSTIRSESCNNCFGCCAIAGAISDTQHGGNRVLIRTIAAYQRELRADPCGSQFFYG